mmetsp:Transcript_2438/g.2770  ORF Transcript_2438/g.2770 Transcript_2438/m.2770 type:complete len:82 (-) Transcript_2438:66-311(-)
MIATLYPAAGTGVSRNARNSMGFQCVTSSGKPQRCNSSWRGFDLEKRENIGRFDLVVQNHLLYTSDIVAVMRFRQLLDGPW